jgi:hypothetical protein
MNLIVYFSMSWVKLGDLLDGYLGIYIIIIKKTIFEDFTE